MINCYNCQVDGDGDGIATLTIDGLAAAAGTMEEIGRIVAQIRARWPQTRIILRADSGFARDALMGWCEANAVDYIFGLARNARLKDTIAAELAEAHLVGRRRARHLTEHDCVIYHDNDFEVFIDPDGHPWEVAHNPHWTLGADGSVTLPG